MVMNKKRRIAAFDFDGTLTTGDSFLTFIRWACGGPRYYLGLLLHAPILALMLLRLYPNGKAKQRVFAHFFKGWRYDRFAAIGRDFSSEIDKMRNEPLVKRLEEHIAAGDTVLVISASLPEWVEPWSRSLGAAAVLATEVEVDGNGVITGRFKTPNCYGQEKVERLLAMEPDRDNYYLIAYGDSRGDRELLAMADEATRVTKPH